MAWAADIPALTNTIAADVPKIELNFQCINDRFAYGTIWIPAGAMIPLITNGAEYGIVEYATNDIMAEYYAFDDATAEGAHVNIKFPEDWDRSTIKAKFYWSSASGSTVGDTVEWAAKGIAISNDDPLDAALGTVQVITDTVLAGTNGDLHITSATPAITIGGTPALADLINLRFYRSVAGTDDMEEDAWLFGALIQYGRTNAAVSAW
uniref:Uncharacterized protein n=1 Tax=viral metagenome TaxID=1070528 RepID=A0A6M3JT71_9ZZZZ